MQRSNNELVRIADKAKARALTRAQRGVSMIEVLIVLTIAAILLGVGVPNLQQYLASNRVVSTSQELYTALQFARSEAMRRGQQVTMRHTGTAGSRDWTSGWTMFVDANGNGAIDAGDETLRVGATQAAPLTVFASANFASFVAFDGNGRLTTAGGGTFVVCHGPDLVVAGQARSRAVLVNGAGRVRPALDTNNDRVPEKDTGAVAACNNP
jgi:type IV fimbrial biogenesis protein FimT